MDAVILAPTWHASDAVSIWSQLWIEALDIGALQTCMPASLLPVVSESNNDVIISGCHTATDRLQLQHSRAQQRPNDAAVAWRGRPLPPPRFRSKSSDSPQRRHSTGRNLVTTSSIPSIIDGHGRYRGTGGHGDIGSR
jgi:hypothetical protein